MIIVDVKINPPSAQTAEVIHAIRPVRWCDHATEMGGSKFAVLSVLDAICWTLGGDRFKPTDFRREGAEKVATRIELDNGEKVTWPGYGPNVAAIKGVINKIPEEETDE